MAAGIAARELDQTPTWAVASVVAVIIIISILLEKMIHHIGTVFQRRYKIALFEALEKVKAGNIILSSFCIFLNFDAHVLYPFTHVLLFLAFLQS